MKPKILPGLMIWISLIILSKPAMAADLNVICDNNGCSKSGNLFTDEIKWYPGLIDIKIINIKNKADESLQIGIKAEREEDISILENVTSVSIVHNGVIWAGYLSNLYQNSLIGLGNLGVGESRDYIITGSLDRNVGNEYQNKLAKFYLDLDFTSIPPVENPEGGVYLNEVMPNASADQKEYLEIFNDNNFAIVLKNWKFDDKDVTGSNNPRNLGEININAKGYYYLEIEGNFYSNENDSARIIDNKGNQRDIFDYVGSAKTWSWSKQEADGWCPAIFSKGVLNNNCLMPTTIITSEQSGGGFVAGASTTISCNDTKPAGVPTNLRAVAGTNSVTLTWDEASGPLTYYLIAFGRDANADDWGNPNIGGAGTNTYIINQLSAGTSYYFKIRAGNGCTPGEFSSIITASPLGVVLPELNTPPAGFEENILGTDTDQEIPKIELINNAGGVKGVSQNCNNYSYPLFFIAAMLFNLLLVILFKKSNILILLAISGIGLAIDYKMSQEGCCALSWCRYYPWGSLLGLIIPLSLKAWKRG